MPASTQKSPPETRDRSEHIRTAALSSTVRFRAGVGLLAVLVAVSVV